MGTAQATFEEVLRGCTTGSHETGSDVSHVTGSYVSHPEVCSAHAQPQVGQPLPAFFFLL